jgi:hypothetical protein
MADNKQLLSIINASGFLFQLRVEQEIRGKRNQHGWRIVSPEHRWAIPQENREGFIDLVLETGTIRAVLECKRVREANWVFLVPEDRARISPAGRLLWTYQTAEEPVLSGHQDFFLEAEAPESGFCVVRGTGEKDRPMLEGLAAVLVKSVEALADQEFSIGESGEFERVAIYLPVIVTNANLVICRFNPSEVDITTGELDTSSFEPVNAIKFRKSLPIRNDAVSVPRDLGELNKTSEQTLFVVNASNIAEFLKQCNIGGVVDSMYAPWNVARRKK